MIWKHVWSGNVMKKLICKQSVYWHKTAFQIKVGLVRHLVIHSHIEMRHPDNWPVYICIYTVVRMFHFNVWMNYTKCLSKLPYSKFHHDAVLMLMPMRAPRSDLWASSLRGDPLYGATYDGGLALLSPVYWQNQLKPAVPRTKPIGRDGSWASFEFGLLARDPACLASLDGNCLASNL